MTETDTGPGGAPERLHILLVGPRIISGEVVGGAKIAFELLIHDLERRGNVRLTVINTSRRIHDRGRFASAVVNCLTLAMVLGRLWRGLASADVVLWNVSPGGAVIIGPFVRMLCAVRRRPLVVRTFGASLAECLAAAAAPVRLLATRTLLTAEAVLVETRQLTQVLGASCRAVWFPNTRDMPPRRTAFRAQCRRFLFLSLLHPEKGLPQLLAAAARFPPSLHLSVFGPASRGFDASRIDDTANATYYGIAAPQDVPATLEAHDMLVLPTSLAGEGHPGVVIEAFQMGLPVLVTPTPPLRELVSHEENGLFVAGSPESILEAALRISSDDGLFRRLREGALHTGARFRSPEAAARIEALCGDAAARGRA